MLNTPSRRSAAAPAKCSRNVTASLKESQARAWAASSRCGTAADVNRASNRAMFEGHDAQIASRSSQSREASVVKSDGFADRPASSVEQVIEEILRQLVEGTRRNSLAYGLVRHPGSEIGVDDEHARDSCHRFLIRLRSEVAQSRKAFLQHRPARQRPPSRQPDPSCIAQNRFHATANDLR